MSRPPTETAAPAGRPTATVLCIVLLAAGSHVAAIGTSTASPLRPPAAAVHPVEGQTAATVPAGQTAPSPPAGADARPETTQPAGNAPADILDPALFVGPPVPPWLFGPPAPGIEALAEGLYVATGYGGNVVARVTPEGVLIAGELTSAADTIAAWVESVTDRPVRYVLRTHRHGNDPATLPLPWRNATLVAPEQPEIVAPEQPARSPAGADAQAPPESPDLAFTQGLSLFLGEAEVRLHYFAPAHTGNDAVVLFPDLGVLFAGDLVVRGLPFIDYAAGGSSRGWVETLDGILALDFDTVVPGAGPMLTKRDVQVFRDRFVTLRMRAMQLLYRDVPREEALLFLTTTDLDWPLAPTGPFAAQSFASLYDELAIEREEARASAAAESDEAPEETERP